ncbi:hypothetical protein [Sinomonas albida]|uniref:hypothetical protein n=1 Tax=Sinomonas albida TaxID=369942 RepID=UPI0010A91426|nr:hypothetical protein [Sinomonas albida]
MPPPPAAPSQPVRRSPSAAPAAILTPGRPFSPAELQAMANDGVLRLLVGDSYAPAAVPLTAELRATALAAAYEPRLRARTVVGRQSAAWIYGCAPAPAVPVLLVPAPRRISSARKARGILVHEVWLGEYDVVELGPLFVTSPLRTAVDLAMHGDTPIASVALRRLLSRRGLGLTPSLVARALDALPRQPRKQRGRDVIARLLRETRSPSA